MKKLTVIILSVILFTACSKNPDQPATNREEVLNPSVQNPQVTRELSGHIYSTINTDPSIQPMQCTGDLPGLFLPDHFLHGNATHLGAFMWEQSTLHHQACNLSFATMQLTAGVSGQMAAANGDLIYYSGNDSINVTNLLLGHPELPGTIQGVWTITGGTGRFTGASGSLTINGQVDFTAGTFSSTARGTIIY